MGYRPVVPGGGGGAMEPPDDRSVNPISTRRRRLWTNSILHPDYLKLSPGGLGYLTMPGSIIEVLTYH